MSARQCTMGQPEFPIATVRHGRTGALFSTGELLSCVADGPVVLRIKSETVEIAAPLAVTVHR